MSRMISDATRHGLGASMAMIESRKHELIDRMEENLRLAEHEDEAFGQSEVTAMMLVEMLLEQARSQLEQGEFTGLAGIAREHERMGIEGRHYSRFGDALVAVLKDLLGLAAPDAIPAAWCDTFWAAIRSMKAREAIAA